MFRQAADAWTKEWGKKPVVLQKSDPGPVKLGRPRGDGGHSSIHETSFNNVHLAVKILLSRQPKVFEKQKEEILMLEKISKSRHSHVVGLVGSYLYEEKRQGCFEIGMLIWPLAYCDLRVALENIDALSAWIGHLRDSTSSGSDNRGQPNFEEDIILAVTNRKSLGDVNSLEQMRSVRRRCKTRLERSFGCMLAAVAWLHSKSIRHRDLKPAQFLLSRDGLWLTDFGCSKEVDLGTTSTYGEDKITVKYHSPERDTAIREGSDGTDRTKHGYPEDVFALGCTFLEMQFRILQVSRSDCPGPWVQKQEAWSYQANIGRIETWMKPFKKIDDTTQSELADGVIWMMTYDVSKRPTIKQVRKWMSNKECFWRLEKGQWSHNLFDSCCKPLLPSRLQPSEAGSSEERPRSAPLVENQKPLKSVSHGGNKQSRGAALGRSETVGSPTALKQKNRSAQGKDSGTLPSDTRSNDVGIDRKSQSVDTGQQRNSKLSESGQPSHGINDPGLSAQKTRTDRLSGRSRSLAPPRIPSSASTGQILDTTVSIQKETFLESGSAAGKRWDSAPPSKKPHKSQADNDSHVSLSTDQTSSSKRQGRTKSHKVTPLIAVTDTTIGDAFVQGIQENRRSSLSSLDQLRKPRTGHQARNTTRLSTDNLAGHQRSTRSQTDIRTAGSSETYEHSRRGSDSSSPTTVQGAHLTRARNFRSKTSSDSGLFWCSSEGCDERFIDSDDLFDHAKGQHPRDALPILLPYDQVKDHVRFSHGDNESSVTCGVPLCRSRYSGCFKEQSLASHMKVRHSGRRSNARWSTTSYDSSDTD